MTTFGLPCGWNLNGNRAENFTVKLIDGVIKWRAQWTVSLIELFRRLKNIMKRKLVWKVETVMR